MTEILTKSALLEQIAQEQAFWEQLVNEIGKERMLEPGATGDWTFKDVVAHLNGWRGKTLARLEAAQHGQAPAAHPWPAHLDEDDDVEEINAWIYRQSRDWSLQEVLNEYRRSFQHMREAVLALSERDLTEPGHYTWMEGDALATMLTSSFGHLHEEHEQTLSSSTPSSRRSRSRACRCGRRRAWSRARIAVGSSARFRSYRAPSVSLGHPPQTARMFGRRSCSGTRNSLHR
jgi:hypothetical protein